ncbi:unnamed protein product [Cuscuta europaea]|uniref:Uncharacterized protein n=1 Tax=Cuscuta europaea TaxID=41803 RepID=A0A9P0YZJ7_CUSEU|nr:unnamed protein product [Cuscuta europaea]
MDHNLTSLPDYYSIKRLGLENPSEGALSQQHPNHALSIDSNRVINYLNKILLEDDTDENNDEFMFSDPNALRAAEHYFYEALGENPTFESSVESTEGTSGSDVNLYSSALGEFKSNGTSDLWIQSSSSNHTNQDVLNDSLYSFGSANLVPNILFDDQTAPILQFQRSVEESRRFFPAINPMVIHFDDKYSLHPVTSEELTSGSAVSAEKEDHSAGSCRRRKHDRPVEEKEEEERSRKQSAACKEEVELSEVFDKVLLCADDNDDPSPGAGKQQPRGRNGYKSRSNKRGDSCGIVDVESLLISCAKCVADADYMAAEQQLKEIRQYSSPTGDANQRLAHSFADGLEARMAGTWPELYPSFRNKTAVSELQKSHMSSTLPFMRIVIFFANKMIYEVASRGASLHVIDFGILHGIQWPTLIRDLSRRRGGPPKLRITGIELPQPGFRPSQMLEETGCRLAKYCEFFNVPFEYNGITATNWEAIKIGDLKLQKGEVVAVNCIDRFKLLLDETVCGADNPRDVVLKLIRDINPHIFAHSVLSASHSSPFFVNRFREALYFCSALFDMFEAIFPRHDSQRLNFEQAFLGPVITNIVACEGMERFERPETYKQWQCRSLRAGFKPLPPNPKVVKKLRAKAREAGHRDFLFAEDGHWVLQGWKGRILSASSVWIPHKP